jgi:hypothetical protein
MEGTPAAVTAFSHKVTLQRKLSGQVFLFAKPYFDPGLKHGIGSNRIARPTAPLVFNRPCKVIAFDIIPPKTDRHLIQTRVLMQVFLSDLQCCLKSISPIIKSSRTSLG